MTDPFFQEMENLNVKDFPNYQRWVAETFPYGSEPETYDSDPRLDLIHPFID